MGDPFWKGEGHRWDSTGSRLGCDTPPGRFGAHLIRCVLAARRHVPPNLGRAPAAKGVTNSGRILDAGACVIPACPGLCPESPPLFLPGARIFVTPPACGFTYTGE